MSDLRVAVVTSNPAGNAARICHYLASSVDGVTVVGAIVDLNLSADRRRQARRLRAWHRHGGMRYVLWRCWLELEGRLHRPPKGSYEPTLHQLGAALGFPVIEVPNVNSPEASEALRRLDVDLGISVGNRIMRESTFTVPRMGMINLHHGNVPDYRGGPPGFWELYDGAPTMGISVHRMDEQLDHGELLGAATIPVVAGDDAENLMARAYSVDYELVGDVVRRIARGTVRPLVVDFSASQVRTLPTRAQLSDLQKRLGRRVRHDDFRRASLPVLPIDTR